jgi:hypothetical protein
VEAVGVGQQDNYDSASFTSYRILQSTRDTSNSGMEIFLLSTPSGSYSLSCNSGVTWLALPAGHRFSGADRRLCRPACDSY